MIAGYRERAAGHEAGRDAGLRASRNLSLWRLATVLPAIGALLLGFSREGHPAFFAAAAILFGAFGALVVRQSRVEERAAWFDALRTANMRAAARVERDWNGLPLAGEPDPGLLAHHPYAHDLDLFGRASLFQWLGPAATPGGAARLGEWLLEPAPPGQIVERQAAVAEIAALPEWRERFAAHGVLASGARREDIDRFLRWAEAPRGTFGADDGGGEAAAGRNPMYFGLLEAVVRVLTAAIWILLALQLTGVVDGAYWVAPAVLGLVLSFAMAKTIHVAFDRAGGGQRALGRYAAMLEHASGGGFRTNWLRAVQSRLTAEGAPAPACMRRLNRILSFAELRSGAALLHFPIQAMTLWDFHLLFALEHWREGAGPSVRGWFDALADLDALAALGTARHDNPSWCFPAIHPEPLLVAEALGHPLIPDARRVSNDVTVGPPGTLLLVTGSNMSGKSTMLRAIGLNAVLAQAGGCACASSMRLPPSDLETSIRVQDSLELGLSYFMAALARLKGVVDAAERPREGRVLLYLLDEILQGTNSAERGIAVRAVARHLLEAGAIGAMTTHDLNLAGEEPLRSSARLVHFTEVVDDSGVMRFDYKLREGIATSRNALRLMKMIGIDL